MFFSAFVFAFLFLWVNFRQATRNNAAFGGVASTARSAFLDVTDPVGQIGIDLSPKFFKLAVATVSAIVALFFALGFRAQWDTYLRFRYGGSFGMSDPLFGADAGFYVFHLPFYELLQSTLMMLTVLALAGRYCPRKPRRLRLTSTLLSPGDSKKFQAFKTLIETSNRPDEALRCHFGS